MTDELRRLLDERGVEHGDVESAPYPPYNSTRRMTTFWANKCVWQYIEDEREGGDIELEGRYMSMSVTPEQAIAATLGSEDTYTREDVEGAFVSGYSLGLDMFDSSKPDNEKGWNQNERDMEEEMEDLGWVRKDAATPCAGTCEADETDVIKCWVKCEDEPNIERMELIHVMECSACGGTYEHVNGGYEFCPRCGRKVVDE